MQKWSVVLALVTAGVSLGVGGAAVGGQPTQQVLKILSDKEWGLTGQVQKPVYETVQFAYTVYVPQSFVEKVEVDGVLKEVQVTKMVPQQQTGTKTVCKFVSGIVCQPVDPKTVKAFETDGRPISAAGVANRCKVETLVVVSADGTMIPDYYATVFKPGTIILAIPTTDSVIPKPMAPPSFAQPAPSPQPATVAPQPAPAAPQPAPATAPSGPPIPSTPAPELVFLARDGADLLKIRQFDEIKTPVKLSVKATDSSISPEKQVTVERMTRHSETMSLDWRGVRISHPMTSDVASDRVKEKLGSSGETTGLLSRDGGPIDEFWLQNIKPSVLIVRGVKLPPVGQTPMSGTSYAVPVALPPVEVDPRTIPQPKPRASEPAKDPSGV